MANRKSKSGGQSQGPKQAAGGGASQSPNPQATNKPRSVAAAHRTAAAPRPPQPQPQANAPRLSNGTKHQNPDNGAPKSQGANGSNFVRVSLSSAEATSGHRASQDRSVNQGTPKRNESGLNNGPQKVQRPSPQPNISSKNAAPKPKHSQAFFGGQSSASNSAPKWSNHIREQGVPRPIAEVVAAKQSGHTQPRAQTAQNHTPTPRKDPTFFSASPAHQQQSGKNTASNTFPKVQVATTQAQRPSRGGQSSAPLVQDSGKPSLKSQQQHKGHTPPKPSTNEGKPPMGSALSTVFSLFSTGSEAPGNPSPKSQHAQQGRAPPHSRLAQETSSKGKCFGVMIAIFESADNTPAETPTNDQGKGQPPTEWVLPKVLSSFFSTESKAPGNPSLKSQHAQQHRAPPHPRPVQEIPNEGHKDTPAKSLKNNERQGHPPAESMPPKVLSSIFSTESKGSGNRHRTSPSKRSNTERPRTRASCRR
ncbi:uncharacterized protein LACBIDRAFT_293747 [Laccaria bicolor S238N-H82]|uniref:Predicted protein n=1 Tax=Laccaria bicolor (strain S238N-H82 / ATCC MYA-4686) TaxID=486041 RepID=B0D667_LACBS|nr:uncharacterized protein LACBIDRAFT_293747 [Laccaria bicolor S238N-H82]EDR10146.1 predicted protein [Laccaria bicolor S238N-H82]|eukprot:XP_001879531.1 predicted protein [Laccaria bicolor S238N-H82]